MNNNTERGHGKKTPVGNYQVGEEYRKKAKAWKKRLDEELSDKDRGKTWLANELNKRFTELGSESAFSYMSVYRWLQVGDDEKGCCFPPYEVMIQIADILGKSVSYLTGETDFDSFKAERTSKYIGLSNDAIRAVRRIVTVFDNPFGEQYHADGNVIFDSSAIELMDKLLTADGLIDSLVLMRRLDTIQKRLKAGSNAIERVEKRYEPTLVRKAWFIHDHRSLPLEPYDQTVEQYWEENKQILGEANIAFEELQTVLRVANELGTAIINADEEDFTGEMVETAYRYQAQKSLSDLLDEVFPPACN